MAENTLLFCLIVNWPLLPRSHLKNSKEYLALNEALSCHFGIRCIDCGMQNTLNCGWGYQSQQRKMF